MGLALILIALIIIAFVFIYKASYAMAKWLDKETKLNSSKGEETITRSRERLRDKI